MALMRALILCIFSLTLISCHSYKTSLANHRKTYKEKFVSDPRSPLKAEDLKDLDFYAPNTSWKLQCSCELAKNAKPFELPTYSGITRTYILHSLATCDYKGKPIQFEIYKNINQPINPLYKDNLFLPFKDITNGETTYGGGRYINLYTYDIIEGKIEIDLNKAYNPWCAYSSGYNCPIPPRANHLDLPVDAGEKLFKGSYKGDH
jgi:uncharacterized protein